MIKKLFKQMVPSQVLSSMTVALCLLIDSIVISRFLGMNSMAAYGFANPILLLFAAFGSFMSTGIQTVCSKAIGNGDEKRLDQCFTVSLTISLIVSTIGVMLVVIFIEPVCVLLGAERGTEVFKLTKDYLLGFIIGAPAFIFAQILVPYMQLAGERVRLVVAVLAMAVVNISLDLVNAFVIKKGMVGMGLASAISYYVAVFIGATYFLKKKHLFVFKFTEFRGKVLSEIFKGGVPTVVNQISLAALVFIINNVMKSEGGDIAVASYSIVSTIATLGYCVGSGISEVSLMLTSMAKEERDENALNDIVRVQISVSMYINLIATAVFLVIAPFVTKLFIADNPLAFKTAVFGLRIFALCLCFSSLNAAFKKYYQGIDMIRFSETISLAQNLVFPAIIVFIFGRLFGVKGVWMFYILGELLSFLYIALYVHFKSKKPIFSHDSFVCLPDEMLDSEKVVFETCIREEKEVEKTSVVAYEFCKNNGFDKKTANYTSLCIEEMANNIIKYGFTPGRDNQIDIRMVKRKDGLSIRIRDNCKNFDPVKYLNMKKSQIEDPSVNIGIRMTFSLVKDVFYLNTLGLNSLTLEL